MGFRRLLLAITLLSGVAHAQISGGFLTEQSGVLQGRAYAWNAGSGISCTLSGTIWTCTATGGTSVATSSPITGDGTGGNPVACPTCVTSVATLGATTALYCDGHDGVCNFDGTTNPVCGATLSGSKYTLTHDICATTVTVANGVDVWETGYAIAATVSVTLTGTAVIEHNGLVPSQNNAGGRLASNGYFCQSNICGGNGGAAGFHSGSGSAGESTDPFNYSMAQGGAGSGGSGCGFTGGAGGANNRATLIPNPLRGRFTDAGYVVSRSNGTVVIVGGPGGGGGCAGSGVLGGAGGTGGGYVYVASPNITVGTGGIQANGAPGAAAFVDSGGTCGCGGGGGAGGFVKIVTQSITSASFSPVNSSTCTSHWTVGGSPGAAVGAGGAATAGAGGTCYVEIAP